MEATMKKFFSHFEDLWVAVAFAEAGEYDSLQEKGTQPRCSESIRMQAI
jgi:hypothetical protein